MDIEGKTLVNRVHEQVGKCRSLASLAVATDDQRIRQEVESFGGMAIMTDSGHPSGTDRCAEALKTHPDDFDAVINIQGDEPFILPEQIEQVCQLLEEGASIATLVRKFEQGADVHDPNNVKVTFNRDGEALYFSRSPIPFDRNGSQPDFFQHIGIYGYRTEVLNEIVDLKPSGLELSESLEQLRWLENGFTISLGITELNSMGVDTPEDLERARHFARTFV